jgi:hypothetical protein
LSSCYVWSEKDNNQTIISQAYASNTNANNNLRTTTITFTPCNQFFFPLFLFSFFLPFYFIFTFHPFSFCFVVFLWFFSLQWLPRLASLVLWSMSMILIALLSFMQILLGSVSVSFFPSPLLSASSFLSSAF